MTRGRGPTQPAASRSCAPEAPLFTDNDPALFGQGPGARAAMAATRHP
jgi:hypothetical protein